MADVIGPALDTGGLDGDRGSWRLRVPTTRVVILEEFCGFSLAAG